MTARFRVPRTVVEWIVGELHAGASAEDAAAAVRESAERWRQGIDGRPLTAAQVRQCVAYGVRVHDRNRGIYAGVMTGRYGKGL